MNRTVLNATLVILSSAALAAPIIDQESVSIKQPTGRKLDIAYTLTGDPTIVTINIETNAGNAVWASIGDRNFQHLAGDVNRVVMPSDTPKRIVWDAGKDWPDHEIAAGNLRVVVEAWATNAPPDYMAVNLTEKSPVAFYRNKDAVPDGIDNRRYKTDCLLLRKIPAAMVKWRMGAPDSEYSRADQEKNAQPNTLHYVTLSDDYYMAAYEMTVSQYSNIYVNASVDERYTPGGATPSAADSEFTGEFALCPVTFVAWTYLRGYSENGILWAGTNQSHKVADGGFLDCLRRFANSQIEFDLPTEAQWEYACRAGTATAYNDGGSAITAVGYSSETSKVGGKTVKHPVDELASNAWGLYDMHGNVSEFCLDQNINDLGADEQLDPAGGNDMPGQAQQRVSRGGNYSWPATPYARSGSRYRATANSKNNIQGFRICAPAVICAPAN